MTASNRAACRRWTLTAYATLALWTSGGQAQEPCVDAPLLSGNVVVPRTTSWRVESQAFGDFTGDGAVDVAMGNANGTVIFHRGHANWWEFDPGVLIQVFPPPTRQIATLVSTDFNGDGKLDLALGDHASPGLTQRIHVMRGNGDGSFQPHAGWGPAFAGVVCLCAADFDGDGDLDLGYAADGGPNPDTIGILWGTGSGSFPTFSTIYQGLVLPGPEWLSGWLDAADIDNDTDVDVIAYLPGMPVVVLRNDPGPTFVPSPFGAYGPINVFNYGHAFTEINGDGWRDVVFASAGPYDLPPTSPDEAIYVRLNNGSGQYTSPPVRYAVTNSPLELRITGNPVPVDLNGDGLAEVAVGRGVARAATRSKDQLVVFRNTAGLLQPPALYHTNHLIDTLDVIHGVADLNSDSRPDLIACNRFETTLLMNDGDGRFLTNHGVPMGPEIPASYPGPTVWNTFKLLTPGDINGDGRFDLVSVRENDAPFLECTVLLQNELGAFTDLFSVPLPERTTVGLALADFDRDANLDIAVVTSSQSLPNGGDEVRVALGHGNGTFDPWDVYFAAGKDPSSVAAGDLNGDLWPDLVVTTRFPSVPGGPTGLSVLLNDQTGAFPSAVPYDVGNDTACASLADLDGDADLDIAAGWGFVSTGGSHGIAVLRNDGNGGFTFVPNAFAYPFLTGAASITLADYNDDDSLDMAFTLGHSEKVPVSGGLVVALNNGDATFTQVAHVGIGKDHSAQSSAVADLNGDQRFDLAISSPAFGTIDVYVGLGDGQFASPVSYGGGARASSATIVADFNADGHVDLGSPLGCSADWDQATHAGFSILHNRTCPACYPDCNQSKTLTIADFGCFQSKFAAGDPYADCNQSNSLTIADFGCFQSKFAQGCP